MADGENVELSIRARDQASAIVGEAIRLQQRYREELKRVRDSADATTEGNRRLGEAFLNQREANRRLQESLKASVNGTNELNGAQANLKEAVQAGARELATQAGAAGRLAGSLGGTALAIGAVVGTAITIVGAFAGASKAIGDFQERQDILADQLDLTQREVGALTLGAANVGRSFEAIQPSLFLFTRRLGEAREGSEEALRSFKALGIDAQRDLRGTGAILGEVARGLDTVGDKAVRNRLLVELFGRGGSVVLPVLRQDLGALADEAERSGITLSESAQRTAREADVAWDQLGAAVRGLRNNILVSMAPIGTEIAKIMGSIVNSIKGVSEESGRTDLSGAIDELDRLRNMAGDAEDSVDRATAALRRQAAESREGGPLVGALLINRAPIAAERETSAAGGLRIRTLGPGPDIVQEQGAILEASRKLSAEAQKQLDQTEKAIALMDLRRGLLSRGVADEIASLEAMKEQVASREELLSIERKIRELAPFAPRRVFGPVLTDEQAAGIGFERERRFSEAAERQLATTREAIALMEDRRLLLALSADEEIKALDSMREQVRSREELLEIERKISELAPLARQRIFGPTITPEQARSIGLRRGVIPEDAIRKTTEDYILAIDRSVLAVGNFASALRDGTQSMVASFGELVGQILTVIGALTKNTALGPIGALFTTITSFLQTGGQLMPRPAFAQGGLVVSGSRGIDSERVLLGRGEAVFSHASMDMIERVMGKMDRFIDSSRPRTREAPSAVDFGELTVNVRAQEIGSRQELRRLIRTARRAR